MNIIMIMMFEDVDNYSYTDAFFWNADLILYAKFLFWTSSTIRIVEKNLCCTWT